MKRIRLSVLLLLATLWLSPVALAIPDWAKPEPPRYGMATTQDVAITATPSSPYPAPTNFLATYINQSQVNLSWSSPPTSIAVMVRAKYGSPPIDTTDGYEVFYAVGNSATDTSMDFEETASTIFYRAWAEYAAPAWSVPADDDVEGIGMTLLALVLLAMGLTVAMFVTRQAMLGFPCVIMWAILGAYAYTESTVPWGDWQFYLFFASLLGMTVFCALGAFGLREKRDTIADEEMEKGEGKYLDEEPEPEIKEPSEDSGGSRYVKRLRDRASKRRSDGVEKKKRF